jgi:DNA-binding response OmpR family regulator
MAQNGKTIKQLILEILADGRPHRREQLLECIGDPLASRNNLNVHLSKIRKELRPKGEDIVCELRERKIHYRHVRLLASPYDGHR